MLDNSTPTNWADFSPRMRHMHASWMTHTDSASRFVCTDHAFLDVYVAVRVGHDLRRRLQDARVAGAAQQTPQLLIHLHGINGPLELAQMFFQKSDCVTRILLNPSSQTGPAKCVLSFCCGKNGKTQNNVIIMEILFQK